MTARTESSPGSIADNGRQQGFFRPTTPTPSFAGQRTAERHLVGFMDNATFSDAHRDFRRPDYGPGSEVRNGRRINRRLIKLGTVASAVVLAGTAAFVGLRSGGEGSPPATGTNPAVEVDDSTTQTTLVKVEIPRAGIYSTVDRLAEAGQIDPENIGEYKRKALELHNDDDHVELYEQITVPVDRMEPTVDQDPTQDGNQVNT